MSVSTSFSRLWLSILRKIITLWARPRVLPEDIKRTLKRSGTPVCYVLETRGVADMVVLQQACIAFDLPRTSAPVVAGEGQRRLADRSLVCLERRTGFLGNRVDRRVPAELRAFVDAINADPTLDVEFVPVNVFWGRAPAKERSWFRLLFAESWDLVGRFRRLLAVVFNGRNLLVQFGEPVSLRASIGEGANAPRAVRRMARMLRNLLRNQRAATIGPDLSHRRTIVTQVLRTQAVRQAVAEVMRDKGLTRREALLEAKRCADEIAANYSHSFVSLMAGALSRLWNRLYDGVEIHNIDRLQAVAEGNEIVYVPCHRSHMDYLLLSYVIYDKGYAVPHIAAGINLNMPVIGSFLRRGGAFFLRRSFRGSTLYTMVFMKYLGLMMARGHAIEYFVEGGRSRTGRLLQPKTGMLSMTVRSYLKDPRRPLVFVPVYFGYERLVEGKSYIGELSGRPKQKETVLGMLKTLPQLRSKFGKVHVSLGEPLKFDDILVRHAPDWSRRPLAGDERPPWLGRAVDELATSVMTNINSAACATPINLIAMALLPTPKQSMPETDLARQVELYASLLRQAPYSPLVHITPMDGASMVRYGESMGILARHKHPLGDVMRMTEENSVLMTYFRNNTVHLLLMPSLIACCFLNNLVLQTEDIQRLAWRIYPYIRDELFLRWNEDEIHAVVIECLDDLANHGLLESLENGKQWRRPPVDSIEAVQLSVLAQTSVQIIERYYLVISLLLKTGSGRITQDALENQCRLMASRMSLLYELNSPEFFDKALFKNFIDLLRARNVLGLNAEGRLTYTELLVAVSQDAQLVLHEQIRNSILQVTHT
ncbi:MAG: glycerol-3-phosphate 1-O-acyltransferase PlsB [Steroidobacteraceae bacterium]